MNEELREKLLIYQERVMGKTLLTDIMVVIEKLEEYKILHRLTNEENNDIDFIIGLCHIITKGYNGSWEEIEKMQPDKININTRCLKCEHLEIPCIKCSINEELPFKKECSFNKTFY